MKAECLAFALQSRIEFGIWGGTNGAERRSMLRLAPRSTDWRLELRAFRSA